MPDSFSVRSTAPLDRLGRHRLASGRSVTVSTISAEPDGESGTLVELGGDVVVVLRHEPADVAELSLHKRPRGAPEGGWPYGCEASVRYEAETGELVVVSAPPGRHGDCCPGSDELLTRWWVDVGTADAVAVIDVLAGLRQAEWRELGEGLLLWRGSLDDRHHAVIELVTDAVLSVESPGDRRDSRAACVATLDIGLPSTA